MFNSDHINYILVVIAGSRCLLTMKTTLKVRRKSAPCIRFVLKLGLLND